MKTKITSLTLIGLALILCQILSSCSTPGKLGCYNKIKKSKNYKGLFEWRSSQKQTKQFIDQNNGLVTSSLKINEKEIKPKQIDFHLLADSSVIEDSIIFVVSSENNVNFTKVDRSVNTDKYEIHTSNNYKNNEKREREKNFRVNNKIDYDDLGTQILIWTISIIAGIVFMILFWGALE